MDFNLLNMVKGYINNDLVTKAASLIGESEAATSKAIETAVPSILISMLGKASNANGASDLISMITKGGFGGDMLSNIGGLLSGNNSDLLSKGTDLVKGLLGDKAGAIASAIASHAGIKTESANKLMSLAAPIVASASGKHIADNNISAAGLVSLFSSQKDSLTKLLPAGIAGAIGISTSVANITASVHGHDAHHDSHHHGAAESPKNKPGSFWWPWLLAGVLGLLLFIFFKGCINDKKNEMTNPSTDIEGATHGEDKHDANTAVHNDSTASMDVKVTTPTAIKVKLPNNVEIDAMSGSLEDRLVQYLNNPASEISKTNWYNFDNLLFENGKSVLKPESFTQLKNVNEILKAYDKVKIKLGGYTDNTGDSIGNVKLSQSRAESVMKELLTMGIKADRLNAEGYGPQYPVGSNDTEEGQQLNRRIAIRVVEK